jgi:hypothetical protein
MSESSKTTSGGISTLSLLGIVFIVLKLTGYIDWSWWWVTLPFWGGIVLVLLVLGIIALFALIYEMMK